jgi:AraC-like DNA-binding protein
MVGAVTTRSVLVEPAACRASDSHCRVIGVSPLLRALLVAAAETPLEYDEAGRDGLVMALLVAELERAPLIPLAVPFPTSPRLAERCHRFLERPDAAATIDGWADALAMNRRRFTRLFRRETGMSFSEWRQQACISIALPRLASGGSVTAVALDLGYESPAAFATMFKRLVGIPPSRYRPWEDPSRASNAL